MEPIRITQLEIHQIGPFGDLTLDFPPKPVGMEGKAEIHILTGENGTGKTTVLEMLAAIATHHYSYHRSRFADDRSYYEYKVGDYGGWRFLQSNGSFYGDTEWFRIHQNYNRAYYQNHENPFSIAFFAYSGLRQLQQALITGITELTEMPFQNALDFKKSINPQLLLQWIANTIASEAIAKTQGQEEQAQAHRRAITQLEQTIGQIIEKPIRFILETKPFKVSIEVAGEQLDFNLLPDGLKSIVSWLADLLMRMDRVKWVNDTPVFERNFILFLDEIEVHMHPAWQRKILPAVQGLFPNAQIFISTHSPFVVGSVDGAWIHKLVKPNGDTRRAELVLSEDARSYRYWLDEIFDIKAEFGEAAQRDLNEFYKLRDALLVNGTPQQREDFVRLAGSLAEQSREMESIVAWEIRQFNKRSSQPVNL